MKKIISIFFYSIVFYSLSHANAVDSIHFPLREEAHNGKIKKLIFGASNVELPYKCKDTQEWMSWSNEQCGGFTNDPKGTLYVKADFNNLSHLRQALINFGENFFDEIWVDHYTFYFTKWSYEHLEILKKLLNYGGSLNYSPEYHVVLMFDEKNFKEYFNYKRALENKELSQEIYKAFIEKNNAYTDYEMKEFFDSIHNSNFLISGFLSFTVRDMENREYVMKKLHSYTHDYTINSHKLLLEKIFDQVHVELNGQYPFKIFEGFNERKLDKPLVLIKSIKH